MTLKLKKKKKVAKKITDKIENTDKDFKEKNNDLKLKKDTIPSNKKEKSRRCCRYLYNN